MKKLLAILLAAMMLLSLAACSNNDDNPSGSENNPGTSQSDNQGGTENQGGEETKEWNENNWQEFLAENYGLSNVSNPGGTVSVMRNASGQIKHIIFDDMPENFNYEEYVGQIWNLCVGAAKDGTIYKQTDTKESDKGRYQECETAVTSYSDVSRSVYGSNNSGYNWFYIWEGGYSDSANADYFIKGVNIYFADSDNDDVDDQFVIEVTYNLSAIR